MPLFNPASTGTAGSWVFLEAHTASSSASLDFTAFISSTYDTYVFEIVNAIPATNAVNFQMRCSTDGGSTYDSAANYSYVDWRYVSGGSAVSGATNATAIPINNSSTDPISNDANYGLNGYMHLYGPGTAIYKKTVTTASYYNSSGTYEGISQNGVYRNATAVNAVQFVMSSGNISSGIVRVYGITKS